MSADFRPRKWLSNGDLQTIVGNFLPRENILQSPTTEFVDVPTPPEMRDHAGAEALPASRILCHCHWQPNPTDCMTVVLLHGLEGSSYSQYVVGNANKLWAVGCNIVRMNMRNCGWSDALSGTLYHSGLSCDAVAVLDWLIARGHQQIALAGYSMGGNLMLKAVGELGASAPPQLKAVVAVSPPADLGESADALGLRRNWIYERRFVEALKKRYRRKRALFPSVFRHVDLDTVRSIRNFDDYVIAPQCGFLSASDYYARAGASRVIDRIAVPTLILHAMDDPFIRLTVSTRAAMQANPHIMLLEPEHGGHCAFLAPADPARNDDGYWAEQQLRDFIVQHAKETAC